MRLAAAVLALVLLPSSALARTPGKQPPGVPIREVPGQLGPAAVAGFDLVVLRPLGFVALCIGSALFVPAAALTVANPGAFGDALDIFVLTPGRNTFTRPLGDF